MESKDRLTAFAVALAQLKQSGKRFSFYQLNQFLQKYLRFANPDQAVLLRYGAKQSLAFPAADLDGIHIHETPLGKEINVVVTFMGLFGPSSPLPAYYTERILHSDDESEAMRCLLDMINHHLIAKLPRTWEKYRYYIGFTDTQKDTLSPWLFSLLGVSSVSDLTSMHLDWRKLLPCLSLLTMKIKNATTLNAIVAHYFDHSSISIEQCAERFVVIPEQQRCYVGRESCQLGKSLVMGDSVIDRLGKFRVHFWELDCESFKEFLPGAPKYKALISLIRLFLRDQLEFDICLHYLQDSSVRMLMGENAMLGWNTAMGTLSSPSEQMVIVA